MKTIEDFKIIVVDDHPLYRKGIKKVLTQLPFPTEIQLFENGQIALDYVRENEINLVLLDVDMPVMDGMKCLKEIKKLNTEVGVIMLSMHDDAYHIEQAYALKANGYLLKDCDTEELHLAVSKVKHGDKYFNSVAKEVIYRRFIEKSDDGLQKKQLLSERETEVLIQICQQSTGAEIAKKLFISEETVKTYRRQLLKKTGSKNLAGLVLFAIKNGIYTD